MTLSAFLAIVVPPFCAYLAPALIHLVFSPDPTSRWGGIVERWAHLGLNLRAFQPEADRVVAALAEKQRAKEAGSP
jgi:hypothetical protein